MVSATATVQPRAWLVWGVAVAAYAVAIMHRTSLGAAGIQAADHFGTSMGIVSTFVVLQLATYAIMQLPAGLLLDRFGSRAMLTVGALIMALGQVGMATAPHLGWAFAARIVLGIGDSFTFGSILRLLPLWFPASRVPVLNQLVGIIGQLGQIAAAAALLPLIRSAGWMTGLLTAAATSLAIGFACLLLVRDAPAHVAAPVALAHLRQVPAQVKGAVGHPATLLGFFIHLTAGFPGIVFTMMWGIPYMVLGQGRSDTEASALFMVLPVIGMVGGPVVGRLTARHPLRRSNLALTLVWVSFLCWIAVLALPGRAPFWLLALLVVTIAAGGPGVGVSFDFTRTEIPIERMGTANGVVITGSFSAGTLLVLLIGAVLDHLSPDGAYTPAQMRLAMALQLPVYAIGIAGIHVTRAALRRRMRAAGIVVPPWPEALARHRRR